MGAGKLTDKLLFGTDNSWMGIPAAFWVCIGIAVALAMLCVSIRLIEIMMTHVKDKGQKFKKIWLNLCLAVVAIPVIPVAFVFFNYVVNTITQTIINNGYLSTKDIGLFIFNSSFDPEREYHQLANYYGGEIIPIGKSDKARINPLEVFGDDLYNYNEKKKKKTKNINQRLTLYYES